MARLLALCFFFGLLAAAPLSAQAQSYAQLREQFHSLDYKIKQWRQLQKENPSAVIPQGMLEDVDKRTALALKLSVADLERAQDAATVKTADEALISLEDVEDQRENAEAAIGAAIEGLKEQEADVETWEKRYDSALEAGEAAKKSSIWSKEDRSKLLQNQDKLKTRKKKIQAELEALRGKKNRLLLAKGGLQGALTAAGVYGDVKEGKFFDASGKVIDFGKSYAEMTEDEDSYKQISRRLDTGAGALKAAKSFANGNVLDGLETSAATVERYLPDYDENIANEKEFIELIDGSVINDPNLKKQAEDMRAKAEARLNRLKQSQGFRDKFTKAKKQIKKAKKALATIKEIREFANVMQGEAAKFRPGSSKAENRLIAGMKFTGKKLRSFSQKLPPGLKESIGQLLEFYADALESGEDVRDFITKAFKERECDNLYVWSPSHAKRKVAEDYSAGYCLKPTPEFRQTASLYVKVLGDPGDPDYLFVPDMDADPIVVTKEEYAELAAIASSFSACAVILEDKYQLDNDDVTSILQAVRDESKTFVVKDGYFGRFFNTTHNISELKDKADALLHIRAALGEELNANNADQLIRKWKDFLSEDSGYCLKKLFNDDKQRHAVFAIYVKEIESFNNFKLRQELFRGDSRCLLAIKIAGPTQVEVGSKVEFGLKTESNSFGAAPTIPKSASIEWRLDGEPLATGETASFTGKSPGAHIFTARVYIKDPLGEATVNVTPHRFQVLDRTLVLRINGPDQVAVNETVTFTAELDGARPANSILRWSLDGAPLPSGDRTSFQPQQAGRSVVSAALVRSRDSQVETLASVARSLLVEKTSAESVDSVESAKKATEKKISQKEQTAATVQESQQPESARAPGDKKTAAKAPKPAPQDATPQDADAKDKPSVANEREKLDTEELDDKDRQTDAARPPETAEPTVNEETPGKDMAGIEGEKTALARDDPTAVRSLSWMQSAVAYLKELQQAHRRAIDKLQADVQKWRESQLKRVDEHGIEIQGMDTALTDLEGEDICVGKPQREHEKIDWELSRVNSEAFNLLDSMISLRDMAAVAAPARDVIEPIEKFRSKYAATWLKDYPGPVDISYSSPCGDLIVSESTKPIASPAAPAETAQAENKLNVTIQSGEARLAPSDRVKLTAVVVGGKGPFSYAWTAGGDAIGEADSVRFVAPKAPGPVTVSILVRDAEGNQATAELILQVDELVVTLVKKSPADDLLPVGAKAEFAAALTQGGKPARAADYVFRWQPMEEVAFSRKEGKGVVSNTALFQKMGRQRVWVETLAPEGESLTTVCVSEPIELEVVGSEVALTVVPKSPAVGQEVTVTAKETPPLSDEMASYWWEIQGQALSPGASKDSRTYAFTPRDDKPVSVTAHLKSRIDGQELGKAQATVTAQQYAVTVTNLGPMGPAPRVWDPDEKRLVEQKNALTTHQNMRLKAGFKTPGPPNSAKPFRYQWTLNKDSHFAGNDATEEVQVNRSQKGTLTATVTVSNKNGIVLGQGSANVEVTVSPEDIQAAAITKKTNELLEQAKSQWAAGELDKALATIGLVASLAPKDALITSQKSRWEEDKAKSDGLLEAARSAIQGAEFDNARKALDQAKGLTPRYPPIAELEKQLKTAKREQTLNMQADFTTVEQLVAARSFAKALETLKELEKAYEPLMAADVNRVAIIRGHAQDMLAKQQDRLQRFQQGEQSFATKKYREAFETLSHALNNIDTFCGAEQAAEIAKARELLARAKEKMQKDEAHSAEREKRLRAITRGAELYKAKSFAKCVETLAGALEGGGEIFRPEDETLLAKARDVLAKAKADQAEREKRLKAITRGAELYKAKSFAECVETLEDALERGESFFGAEDKKVVSKARDLLAKAKRALAQATTEQRAAEKNPEAKKPAAPKTPLKIASEAPPIVTPEITKEKCDALHEAARTFSKSSKNHKVAIARYQEVLKVCPQHCASINGVGANYVKLGDDETAVKWYRKAVECDPSYTMAKDNLARCESRLSYAKGIKKAKANDVEGALAMMHESLRKDPKNCNAMIVLATIEEKRNNTKTALAWFEKAIVCDPKNKTVKQHADKLRQSKPVGRPVAEDCDKAFRAALAKHKAGNLNGAQKAYLAALKKCPKLCSAMNNLGVIAKKNNRNQDALAWFKKAAACDSASFGKAAEAMQKIINQSKSSKQSKEKQKATATAGHKYDGTYRGAWYPENAPGKPTGIMILTVHKSNATVKFYDANSGKEHDARLIKSAHVDASGNFSLTFQSGYPCPGKIVSSQAQGTWEAVVLGKTFRGTWRATLQKR